MRRSFLLAGTCVALLGATAGAATPVFSAAARLQGPAPAAGGGATLVVEVTVQPGWHVNSDAPLDPYLIPTQVRLDLPPGWTASRPAFPPSTLVKLAFSEDKLAVFAGRFEVTMKVNAPAGSSLLDPLRGAVEAQACNDRVCLAPVEVPFAVALARPADAVASAPARPTAGAPASVPGAVPGAAANLASATLLVQLAVVFLAGLALNLTPCVYPLIPITVGYFAAQRRGGRGHTWLLAATYVIGMSVTYSALGVGAALSGRLFGSALQSPWVVGLIVLVMLALASSMFGLWEIRVPAWASRASGGRGGVAGALVMGLVVGLVAAPCIGPFVLGLLTYVGQRQDVWLGFALFFTLSLGLGVPYLLLGGFAGAIERLPYSGAWMTGVRQLFGVLLTALAGYFARPLLGHPAGELVFAGLLVCGGAYLLVVARPGHDQPWVDRFMRLASAAVLMAGVLLLPARERSGGTALAWQPYDEGAVANAIAGNDPVVLDFHATWCIPCKELDEKTFSQPEVAAALARFRRFKVDLTASDPQTDALRRRFDVAGVPTIVFYRGGREVVAARLTGFEPAAAFLQRLAKVEGG